MIEQQWLTSADPAAMLSFLWHMEPGDSPSLEAPPLSSDRKVRLFACGCCRLVWDKLTDDTPCRRCDGTGEVVEGTPRSWPPQVSSECPDCGGAGRVNRSRRAVEVAERFADGLATAEERLAAFRAAHAVPAIVERQVAEAAAWDAAYTCSESPRTAAEELVRPAYSVPPAAQADLLRCVFGNPWKPVTPVWQTPVGRWEVVSDPDGEMHRVRWSIPDDEGRYQWVRHYPQKHFAESQVRDFNAGLVVPHHELPLPQGKPVPTVPWLTPTVIALVSAAYEDRLPDGLLDPVRLAVLGDALEEAGCAGETVALCCCGKPLNGSHDHNSCGPPIEEYVPHPLLAHLRGPGPHARGCWAVDLILGKG